MGKTFKDKQRYLDRQEKKLPSIRRQRPIKGRQKKTPAEQMKDLIKDEEFYYLA